MSPPTVSRCLSSSIHQRLWAALIVVGAGLKCYMNVKVQQGLGQTPATNLQDQPTVTYWSTRLCQWPTSSLPTCSVSEEQHLAVHAAIVAVALAITVAGIGLRLRLVNKTTRAMDGWLGLTIILGVLGIFAVWEMAWRGARKQYLKNAYPDTPGIGDEVLKEHAALVAGELLTFTVDALLEAAIRWPFLPQQPQR
ncbi:hypothetical protein MTO96_022683 [Rhipicephalus appendiculatus]